jgi:hypothetical protein
MRGLTPERRKAAALTFLRLGDITKKHSLYKETIYKHGNCNCNRYCN